MAHINIPHKNPSDLHYAAETNEIVAAVNENTAGKEEDLRYPTNNGYILASDTDGRRYWVPATSDGSHFVEIYSDNIIDGNSPDIALGYYVNWGNGLLSSNADYQATGWCVVNPNTVYSWNKTSHYAWYDSSKVFISGNISNTGNVLSPSNAAFIRMSFTNGTSEMMGNEGVLKPYIPYGSRIELTGAEVQYSDVVNAPVIIGEAPTIQLPDKIYAVVGDTLELWYNAMITTLDAEQYHFRITCNVGMQLPDKYSLLPTAAGTHGFRVDLIGKDQEILESKLSSIIVKAAVSNPAAMVNVWEVGDSLSAGGKPWFNEIRRRITGVGTPPSEGSNVQTHSFTNFNLVDYGESGKQWNWFATSSGLTSPDIIVTAVGHGKTDDDIKSRYVDNHGKYWSLEAIDGDDITLLLEGYLYDKPAISGTLTYHSGGVTTNNIVYSNLVEKPGNRFWNPSTDKLDFQYYASSLGLDAPQHMYILLTWNGMAGFRTDAEWDVWDNDVYTFIDQFHLDYPTGRVTLISPQMASITGGLGTAYGAKGQYYSDASLELINVKKQSKIYQRISNEAGYSTWVDHIESALQVDTINNMPSSEYRVNTRSDVTELRGTNGVHPNNNGYNQIGDTIYRHFICNYCQ